MKTRFFYHCDKVIQSPDSTEVQMTPINTYTSTTTINAHQPAQGMLVLLVDRQDVTSSQFEAGKFYALDITEVVEE